MQADKFMSINSQFQAIRQALGDSDPYAQAALDIIERALKYQMESADYWAESSQWWRERAKKQLDRQQQAIAHDFVEPMSYESECGCFQDRDEWLNDFTMGQDIQSW